MDGRIERRMDGRMDGWTDGWMNRLMDEQIDGWMDGYITCIHACIHTYTSKYVPKQIMKDVIYSLLQTFINCTCVTESLYSNNSNISYDVILANNSTASDGQCHLKCSYLIPFVIIIVVSLFLVFTSQIPHAYFTMRSVD